MLKLYKFTFHDSTVDFIKEIQDEELICLKSIRLKTIVHEVLKDVNSTIKTDFRFQEKDVCISDINFIFTQDDSYFQQIRKFVNDNNVLLTLSIDGDETDMYLIIS